MENRCKSNGCNIRPGFHSEAYKNSENLNQILDKQERKQMKKTKILTLPNPILRQVAKEVGKMDENVQDIIERMKFAIEKEDIGLGLAAPQIGESLRIITIRAREIRDENGKLLQKEIPLIILVNPKVTKFSKDKVVVDEGCLSYPGIFGKVERPKKVKVEAISENGKKVKINASGLLARIIQHEVDHLNGILFIDYIKDQSKLEKMDLENDRKKRTKKL